MAIFSQDIIKINQWLPIYNIMVSLQMMSFLVGGIMTQ